MLVACSHSPRHYNTMVLSVLACGILALALTFDSRYVKLHLRVWTCGWVSAKVTIQLAVPIASAMGSSFLLMCAHPSC